MAYDYSTCGECSYQNLNLESVLNHLNSVHGAIIPNKSPNTFFTEAHRITLDSQLDESHSGSTQSEDNSLNNSTEKSLLETKWTTNSTMLLIRLVEKNYNRFDTEFKKNVWNRIASELCNLCPNFKVTASQCGSP